MGLPIVHVGNSLELDWAAAISGKKASQAQWARYFPQQHRDKLKTHKAQHLDPKHARNSNKTNVAGFHALLNDLERAYSPISPEHIWNVNEKGIRQVGGVKRLIRSKQKMQRVHRRRPTTMLGSITTSEQKSSTQFRHAKFRMTS